MSDSTRNGTGSARYTTTAVINCMAYPADSPPQKQPVTKSPSLQNGSSIGARNFSLSNGHDNAPAKPAYGNGVTFPSKVQFGNANGTGFASKGKFGSSNGQAFPPKVKLGSTNGNGFPAKVQLDQNNTQSDAFPSQGFARNIPVAPPAPPQPNFNTTMSGANPSGVNRSQPNTMNGANSIGVNRSQPNTNGRFQPTSNSLPRGYSGYSSNGLNSASSAQKVAASFTSSANGRGNPSAQVVRPQAGVDTSNPAGKPKVDVSDPQVRKLVYNMYRGLLDNKHSHSNSIIDNKSSLQVDTDEGVKNRVLCMM